MENYIVTVTAKPGEENAVARFYRELEPLLQEAPGFLGRQIMQARVGTMSAWVQNNYSAEELARHPGPSHDDEGTHFVVIEKWQSVDDRMNFTKERLKGLNQSLFPLLLPGHSHEFYEDISV